MQTGAVKTMTLQLAVRQNNKMGVDIDDLNYVRVLTQVCEVDSKRYQDVILIGGTKVCILYVCPLGACMLCVCVLVLCVCACADASV